MNITKRLYELQLIDVEIHGCRETIAQLNLQIGDNDVVLKAKAELDALKKHLAEIGQKRRDLDGETEDLQGTISKLNDKLYGGKIGNPKELLSLEQEVGGMKDGLRQKEDELLGLMNEEEVTQKKIAAQTEQVGKVETEWQQQQKALTQKRAEMESRLLEFENKRQAFIATIDAQSLGVYEGVRLKRGPAVVKVEQGRCQGCRITLPVNEWQKTKSGVVVQCSSCGKILYLE